MKKCPVCHTDYPDHFAFCPIDGAVPVAWQGTTGGGTGISPAEFEMARRKRNRRVIILVVGAVAVFFFLPFMAILALIAIPSFGTMKKVANETSAIQSVRSINLAEMQYEATYPDKGYTCSLNALGGDMQAGAPTPEAAQLLQGDILSGSKSGYLFSIGNCTKVTTKDSSGRIVGYEVTAVPQRVKKTGNRGFCSDQMGLIKTDPAGGTNCRLTLQY